MDESEASREQGRGPPSEDERAGEHAGEHAGPSVDERKGGRARAAAREDDSDDETSPSDSHDACARPLVWFALALASGLALGRTSPGAQTCAPLVIAALAGAWFARARRSADAPTALRSRPGVVPLALVVAFGVLRAPHPSPTAGELASAAHTSATRAAADDAPSHAGAGAVLRGQWQPTSANERGVFGRLVELDGLGRRALLPHASARPGEQLELLPSARPMLPARGLSPAPRAVGSLDSDELWRVHTDEVRRVEPASTFLSALAPIDVLREWSLLRCERFGPAASPLARALLFGDESRMPYEAGELFTRTGVRHVLSVSGMHVALLAGALGACSLWASGRRARRVLAALTLGAIGLYSLLSGAQAPVRRAALTLCLGLAATAWTRPRSAVSWRRPDALNLLAAALTVELLVDPRTLFTLSLQLSYSATLGLVLGAGPLSRWVARQRRAATNAALDRAWELAWLRPWSNRLGAQLGESARLTGQGGPAAALTRLARALDTAIGASLAASLATAPLTWLGIGELCPVGPLTTVCAGPLVAWLLTYGLAAVYLPLPIEGFSAPTRWLFELLAHFDAWPFTPWPCPPRPLWLGAAASLGLLLWASRASVALRDRGRRVALASAGLAVLPWASAPKGLELVALDVGHGTAVAVRTPRNEVWMVDAGSSDRHGLERRALGPQLAAWEPARLNLVITHRDHDHAGAAPWLASRWKIAHWIGPTLTPDSARPNAAYLEVGVGGAALRFGELALDVAAGASDSSEANEGSSAVAIQLAGRCVIVTGDAVAEGVDAWLASARLPARADVVLWPHHGDPTERASELLAALDPRSVWISAARAGGIESELERRSISWKATYRAGPLHTVLEPAPP